MDQYALKARAYQDRQNLGCQSFPDSPAPRQSALDNSIGRLQASLTQMSLLREALATLEGRLMGGSPPDDGGKAQIRPMPTGHIGQMNCYLDDLFSSIENCQNTVKRLGDAI